MKPLLLSFALLLGGCATSKQTASYPVLGTDGAVIGFGTATSTVFAIGDAKQVIDKVRASSGKTASVGASGMDQQSNISDFIKSLTEMLQTVKPPTPVP